MTQNQKCVKRLNISGASKELRDSKNALPNATKKHSPRYNRGCALSNNVSLLLMFLVRETGLEASPGDKFETI